MRIAYLASGAGSLIRTCAQAVEEKVFPGLTNACLVSDRVCKAQEVAKEFSLPALCLDFASGQDKNKLFDEMLRFLQKHDVDMLLLTFNRLLPASLIEAFPQKILNVHGSLLPSFTGFGAIPAALSHGVTYLGSTVHLVDHSVDGGPIVVQGIVPVKSGEKETMVREKLYRVQQQMVLHAVDMVSQGRLHLEGRRAVADQCDYSALPVNPKSPNPAIEHFLASL